MFHLKAKIGTIRKLHRGGFSFKIAHNRAAETRGTHEYVARLNEKATRKRSVHERT
jgi:hypothetical protein